MERECNPRRACRGLTLVELLVALAVLAVLLGLAAPSFGRIAAGQRASAAVNTLVASFQQARMRALARAGHVGLCPSSDGLACSGGLDWHRGWLGWDDLDGDRRLDPDEPVHARHEALPEGVAATSSVGRPRLHYGPDGSADGSNLTLTVCLAQAPGLGRVVVVNNAGRPRTGPAAC
jgi:type IV fimbrial biogenesis protein FimT